jgi:hypothetical protein
MSGYTDIYLRSDSLCSTVHYPLKITIDAGISDAKTPHAKRGAFPILAITRGIRSLPKDPFHR